MSRSKNTRGADTPPLTDPATGRPAPTGDVRDEFDRLSRQTPRDAEADRAFIESKIELIRTDPRLTEAEKQQAIEELRQRLARPLTP